MAHDNLAGASVVVGFDGSKASRGSVVLAAREAVMRSRPLEILHAIDWPTDEVPGDGAGDIETRSTIVVSSPAAALVSASKCGEIVLGVDGSPKSASALAFAFDEAALSGASLHKTSCPIAIVRPGRPAA